MLLGTHLRYYKVSQHVTPQSELAVSQSVTADVFKH